MLAEALEHLVRGIVRHPDDVSVRDKQLRRGSLLEVRVNPDDLGKVIGRNGRTATALRTVSARSPARAAPASTSSTSTVAAERQTASRMPRAPRPIEERHEHDEVVVGRIGRPHGIRGEVSVELRTDEPERRFAAGNVLARDASRLGTAGRADLSRSPSSGALAPGPAARARSPSSPTAPPPRRCAG